MLLTYNANYLIISFSIWLRDSTRSIIIYSFSEKDSLFSSLPFSPPKVSFSFFSAIGFCFSPIYRRSHQITIKSIYIYSHKFPASPFQNTRLRTSIIVSCSNDRNFRSKTMKNSSRLAVGEMYIVLLTLLSVYKYIAMITIVYNMTIYNLLSRFFSIANIYSQDKKLAIFVRNILDDHLLIYSLE